MFNRFRLIWTPILNLDNFRVIGIHIGSFKNQIYYFGKIIKLAIDDFKIKNNYIIAEIEIEEEDINKDIRIINSIEQWERQGK